MSRLKYHDVRWYLPNGQKPIAGSTVHAANIIRLLGEGGSSVQQARDKCPWIEQDAAEVLNIYIARGFGSLPVNELRNRTA